MPTPINTIPYHPKELEKLFIYNPDNGKLYNRSHRSPLARKGMEAGTMDNGYRKVRIDGVAYKTHRIIWKMCHGADPVEQIDHIDHDPLNNRIENMREASSVENNRNSSRRKDNVSGVTGVHFKKGNQKWAAKIHVEGKAIHLGFFTQRWHAIRARKLAEIGYGFHQNHGAAA